VKLLKTKLLDGEEIFREIKGVLSKNEVEAECVCYLTNRRLIFELINREEKPEVEINLKKLITRSVIGGVLAGPVGGGLGGASSVEVRTGEALSDVSVFWADEVINLDLGDKDLEVTFQKGNGHTRRVLYRSEKPSEWLTKEEKERIETLVQSSKDMHAQVNALIDRYATKGYLNPKSKLQSCISAKMQSGKTKKQAIKELYECEETSD